MSFGKQIVGALKSLTAMWGFCISQFIVSVCATGVVVGMLYGTMQTRDGLAPELLEFIRSGGTADVNSAWLQRLSYVVLLISSLVTVLWLLTGYTGIDPEFDSLGAYPNAKTFSFGVNLTF